MKLKSRNSFIKCVASVLLVASSCAWAGTTHSSKTVAQVRPGGDRVCTLFTLTGVSVADPVGGTIWFVIEPTAPGFKEMVATLLAAKAGNTQVTVTTTGAVSSTCGHSAVSTIIWE